MMSFTVINSDFVAVLLRRSGSHTTAIVPEHCATIINFDVRFRAMYRRKPLILYRTVRGELDK
jgi:hypothetical protein